MTRHAFWVGLAIRLFLAWILPLLLDEHGILPGVAYTDIDYHVFSDAAAHVQQGRSPYARHTYRYTPFLAQILASMPTREAGRYIFCIADALCGWLIVQFRKRQREEQQARNTQLSGASTDGQCAKQLQGESPKPSSSLGSLLTFLQDDDLQDTLWWLYNPLAINICTRGSAESFMVLLPVLLTLWLVSTPSFVTVALAGVCHGVAVHAKLYPIIYSLSIVAHVSVHQRSSSELNRSAEADDKWSDGEVSERRSMSVFCLLWFRRFLTPLPLLFGVVFVATFVGLTYLAYVWYGPESLQEGLLYHFSRVDHRHNYAMHWYWIYLLRAAQQSGGGMISMAVVGRILLLPQLVLLVFTSLGIAPSNLNLAFFVQTFLFVAMNKVITAQYFTWYLCLLPLCSHEFCLNARVRTALALLLASVGVWLGSAYCLEMQGMAVHRVVWFASVLFFLANVNLLGALLQSTRNGKHARNIAEPRRSKMD